jgi:hypothetical protein
VLDLCTGTGCIPLLVQHDLLSARGDLNPRVLGVDISDKALKLALHNLQRLRKNGQIADKGSLEFLQADILIDPFADQTEGALSLKAALNWASQPSFWDVLISNPPYISPSAFWKTTTRSVRHFEPQLALVPPWQAKQTDTEQGDLFYPRLLDIARDVEAKVVLLEVADMKQALRVAQCARNMDIFDGVEIWREQPSAVSDTIIADDISVVGEGNARSVLCWRGLGTTWLGKSTTGTLQQQDAHRLFRSSVEGMGLKAGSRNLEAQFDMEASSEYTGRPLARWLGGVRWGVSELDKAEYEEAQRLYRTWRTKK